MGAICLAFAILLPCLGFIFLLVIAPTCSLLLLSPEMTRSGLCTQQGLAKRVCETISFSSLSTSQTQDPREKASFILYSFSFLQTIGTYHYFFLP